MTERDFECQLRGYSLTTAEILYYLPDHRELLQSFVWQDYDMAPRFPRLIRFLDFWTRNLDGPLASVRVAHRGIIGAAEMRFVGAEWRLH
jgi:uncharacterized protein Usg